MSKAYSKRSPILSLDIPADIKYDDIRAELEAAGQTIGLNGLLIDAESHRDCRRARLLPKIAAFEVLA